MWRRRRPGVCVRALACALAARVAGALAAPRLLCDGPTPALLVDVDALGTDLSGAEAALAAAPRSSVREALFLHCRVTEAPAVVSTATAVARDATRRYEPVHLATLDAPLPAGGAFLCMGLNNHWDADYYWARSAGPNARKPAPGIGIVAAGAAATRVVRLDATDAAVAQTNDGKRSEWCDYLRVGDECDLIPNDPDAALALFEGRVFGVSRNGRPLGAEPFVSAESWLLPPV